MINKLNLTNGFNDLNSEQQRYKFPAIAQFNLSFFQQIIAVQQHSIHPAVH